jgi:hypothetical protein
MRKPREVFRTWKGGSRNCGLRLLLVAGEVDILAKREDMLGVFIKMVSLHVISNLVLTVVEIREVIQAAFLKVDPSKDTVRIRIVKTALNNVQDVAIAIKVDIKHLVST